MSLLVTGSLAVAGAAAVTAGFGVRPGPPTPVGKSHDRGLVPLDSTVPALLAAHLDLDHDGFVPRMDSIAMWGRAKVRLGRSPWLPVRMLTRHRVGRDFASDINVTWYGRTVLEVIDAYVRGRGMAGPERRPDVGDEIDQGANLFLWSEGVLIPSVFADGTPVKAVEDDASTVRLEVPFHAGTDSAWLHFDGERPHRFAALRHKGLGGEKLWWYVDMRDWFVVDGIALPRHIEVTWEDEDRPWFRLDVDGFAANVDLDVDMRLNQVDDSIRAVRVRRGLPY
ncbi:MAG TPA: DUF6544 family protein [Jiangellaceae bacterium]